MIFVNLLIFIIAAYFLSLTIKQRIELLLPAFTAMWLVMLYGLAILGYSHHSFHLSIIIYILVYAMYAVRNKRLFPDFKTVKETLMSNNHIGFFVYLFAVIVAFYCYSNHVVNVWDDFHYNATFPKNMFLYGTMPNGYQSTTMYKDYFPTQQLFFYWGFQSIKAFSEPLMFQYKLFLAYTFTLPIFNEINSGKVIKRLAAAVTAVILPYLCLFEIYESLSMDTVLALLFANVLFGILRKDKSWFGYGYIAVMLMALVLYKSYALIFACVAIAAWFFSELTEFKKLEKKLKIKTSVLFLLISMLTMMCYLSWKVFCKVHGNTTYLSNILSDNVQSGKIVFPEYALPTFKNIINSLWSMRLNFGPLSITVFSGVVIYLAVIAVMIIYNKYSRMYLAADIMILAGLTGFIMFLIYTFIFIFEPWEADSLSSLDRYLGTYVLVLMFISAYRCLNILADVDLVPVVTFAAICVVSLNYNLISRSLIPVNYAEYHSNIIDERNKVHDEISEHSISSLGPSSVVLVSDEEDTLYMRSMQFECIPLHAYQFVITDCTEGMEGETLMGYISDTGSEYVYITEHASDYADRLNNLDSICADGITATKSGLYKVDRENKKITEILN